MSLNATPRGERTHIAVFGRTNVGKSSVVNALTGQETAVVSPVRGTTTDPVYKAMELLPLGPVVLIDTAGLDDEGTLGELRKQKTRELIHRADLALLVIDALAGADDFYRELLGELRQRNIPVVGVLNKVDTLMEAGADAALAGAKAQLGLECVAFSALNGRGVPELKRAIVTALPHEEERFRLVGDLVAPGDLVVLVVPIDKAAPKGRLILPQQQTIRDLLESDATAVVTKEHELRATLERLGTKPRLVITDSQVFLKVAADTPKDVPLTSFSILFARHKGDLNELVRGARAVENLRDGDRVLIAEACTHHQQSDDIGTVKIPRWLRQATGKQLQIEHVSGYSYPPDLARYALIVHCGACMLNRRAMLHRLGEAQVVGVPIVNYGVLIAYLHGVFPRAIELFPSAVMAWEEAAREPL